VRKRFLTLFTLAASLYAAGTVTQGTVTRLGQTNAITVTLTWTGDASNGSVPATTIVQSGPATPSLLGYSIISLVTDPGSPAPTDNYDITITNTRNLDLMQGQCANRDTSTTESCSADPVPVDGAIVFNLSGNSQNSAVGVVVITFVPQTVAKRGGSGGNGSGDVTGPASSADDVLVAFNGATGKIIKEATGCSVVNGALTCAGGFAAGDGTLPSISMYPELTANGTNSAWVVGAENQSADTCYVLPAANGTAGQVLLDSGTTASIDPDGGGAASARTCRILTWGGPGNGSISVVIDGGGSEITTGAKGWGYIPYSGTITGVEMTANTTCDAVVDLWVDAGANFPPTDADSITASAPPTLSMAVRSVDTTLTGWDTAITAGDYLRANVDSNSGCSYIVVALTISRSN
jgi:hypothetical protein